MVAEAHSLPIVPTKKRDPKDSWTINEKIRVLAEASTLTGAELTALLVRESLLLAELEQWRLALGEEPNAAIATTYPRAVCNREHLAADDEAAVLVRDGERVALAAVGRAEPALEVDAPHAVGSVALVERRRDASDGPRLASLSW